MQSIIKYNLLLDDVRKPIDVWNITHNLIYLQKEWMIVKSFKEFRDMILNKIELPEIISFDHDLADEHYRPSMYDKDKHYNKYYTDGTFKEKTGYDCAQWLVDYCLDNNVDLPICFVHSMNPVGKENIEILLKNFIKLKKNELD